MTDHEPPAFVLLPDTQEYGPGELEPSGTGSRPPFSRRQRLAAALVALVVLASGIALQRHRAGVAARTAGTPPVTEPAPAPSPAGFASQRPWPTVPGPCGESALLPIVHTTPLTEPTSIRLLVGGAGQSEVDLDTGSVTPVAGLGLPSGTSVLAQQPLDDTVQYLTTATCNSGAEVVRVSAGRPAVSVFGEPFSAQLYPDGAGGIWSSQLDTTGTEIGDGKFQIDLVRLDKTERVPLPVGYQPIAVHAGQVVAASVQPNSSEQRLVLYDLAGRRIVRELGTATSYTQSQGRLLWLTWPCQDGTPCPLHSYDLASGLGSVHGYSLPYGTDLTGSVLSANHTRLAFTLPRGAEDPRYYGGAEGNPADLMVLNLASNVLESVPNLELPPGLMVSSTFSRDGRWLVLAMNLTAGPQLLLWRSGLAAPQASAAKLTGPAQDPLLLQLAG